MLLSLPRISFECKQLINNHHVTLQLAQKPISEKLKLSSRVVQICVKYRKMEYQGIYHSCAKLSVRRELVSIYYF